MIARLRARHARVWRTLLLVVPVVLVAALSVRRGEPARQELPPVLQGEVPPAVAISAPLAPHEVRWRRDPATGQRLLELRDTPVLDAAAEADLLLYWSSHAAEGDGYEWSEGDPARSLPTDAVLLGPWRPATVNRYVWPEKLDPAGGGFWWYSLGRATVVSAPARIDVLHGTEPPR